MLGFPRVIAVGAGVASLALLSAGAASGRTFNVAAGRFVITPLTARGVLVAGAAGHDARRLCPSTGACPRVTDARWSPDGEEIAYAGAESILPTALSADETQIMYENGSCLTCSGPLFGAAPAFERTPDTIDVIQGGRLVRFSSDGRRETALAGGDAKEGTVSSHGTLAVVRGGRIWTGPVHHLRAGPRGSQPDWSPTGRLLAYVHRRRVMTLSIRNGHRRNVAVGSSPSWSPDSRQLAYLASDHRVRVLDLATGRSQWAGDLRGHSVSWGPTPSSRPASCRAPRGSRVIADSDQATLVMDGGRESYGGTHYAREAVLGCVEATGRERVLLSLPAQPTGGYDYTEISDPTVTGTIAGVISSTHETHYGASSQSVEIFDLGTGLLSSHLGGQYDECGMGYGCETGMGDLVINPLGDSAVLTTQLGGSTDTEAIAVSDSSGRYQLDQHSSQPPSSLPNITALSLNDTTLTWQDNGQPQTAQLRQADQQQRGSHEHRIVRGVPAGAKQTSRQMAGAPLTDP